MSAPVGRAPTLHQFIIRLATTPPNAWRALQRFGQTALREELRGQDFLVILPDLEAAALQYAAVFATAAAVAGATAESVVTAVLAAYTSVSTGAALPGGGGGGGGLTTDPTTTAESTDTVSADGPTIGYRFRGCSRSNAISIHLTLQAVPLRSSLQPRRRAVT